MFGDFGGNVGSSLRRAGWAVLVSVLVLGLAPAVALADTTVGATTSTANLSCNNDDNADFSESVPTGGGTITSLSYGGSGGTVDLQVLKVNGGGSVTVVGHTGEFSPTGGVTTFPVSIPVSGGEVLGLYVSGSTDECATYPSAGSFAWGAPGTDPSVGDSFVVAGGAPPPYDPFQLNASATLDPLSFPNAAVTYGQADFSPASSSAAGTITYTSVAGQCTAVNGATQLHITGVGSCTATANQAGATPIPQTFTVNPAPLTAVVVGGQTYGGGGKSFSVSKFTGLANGDQPSVVSGSLTGCVTSVLASAGAGSYPGTITGCSGLSAANYTISYSDGGFTVSPASLTAVVTGSQTYGGGGRSFSVSTFNGLISPDTASVVSGTLSGCTVPNLAPAGPYTGTISGCTGLSAANYTISYSNGGFTVSQASQLVSFGSTAPSSAWIGIGSYTPSANATSGLPVAITLDPSSSGCAR